MWYNVLTIYLKDLKETLRDRRTLIFMILFPTVLMPMILKITTSLVGDAEEEATKGTIQYAIFNGDLMPNLAKAFSDNPGFELVALASRDEIKAAIREDRISLAVGIPDDASKISSAGEQVTVELYYNNASMISKVKNRAASVIEGVSDGLRNAKLETFGVSGSIKRDQLLKPLIVRDRGVAEQREVIGTAAGGMLSYFFIIFCFLGCMYPAIDLGAGEKERGTLETLLLVPVPRFHLVLGKYLVVFTCGVTSAVLSLSSMVVWLLIQGDDMPPEVTAILKTISALDLISVGAMMIPIAGMFAGLLLAISIFARSFKEAQSYTSPLTFVVVLPAMLAMIPGVELNWRTAMIPVTNISLAMKELVKGTMDYTLFTAILGSSTLIAACLLAFCSFWFKQEKVLFRE